MTNIPIPTGIPGASLSTQIPCNAHRVGSGFKVGATNILRGMAIYITPLQDGDLVPFILPAIAAIATAPVTTPGATAGGTDGTWGVGTYIITATFAFGAGETSPGLAQALTLGATQHITIPITVCPTGSTGLNVYVNGVMVAFIAVGGGGSTASTNILAPSATLPGLPAGANKALTGTVAGNTQFQHIVHGFAGSTANAAQTDAVTIYDMVDWVYGTALTQVPGTPVYLDPTVPGGINDTSPSSFFKPCGVVLDNTRIRLWATHAYA